MNIDRLTRNILYHEIFETFGTDWSKISQYPNLPEGFIDAYFPKLKMFHLEQNQTISRRLQLKYKQYWNWILMSKFQSLDEDIIELMKNKVNWIYIAKYQRLSEDFIKSHANYLNFDMLKYNKNISLEIICSVKKYFDVEEKS